MRWIVAVCLWSAWTSPAIAHPGALDACGGHIVVEHVDYPPNPDGQPSYPSEAGEYHFHFTPDQIEEAKWSLEDYRATHQRLLPQGVDYGSFTVGGITYDILEQTRQDEAILHCQGDDEVTHTGIGRALVE